MGKRIPGPQHNYISTLGTYYYNLFSFSDADLAFDDFHDYPSWSFFPVLTTLLLLSYFHDYPSGHRVRTLPSARLLLLAIPFVRLFGAVHFA